MTIARSLLSGIMMVGIWIPHPLLHSHPRPSTPQSLGINQKFSKNFLILVIWGQLWWEIPHWSDLINYIRHQTSDIRWKIKVSFVNFLFFRYFMLIKCGLGFCKMAPLLISRPNDKCKSKCNLRNATLPLLTTHITFANGHICTYICCTTHFYISCGVRRPFI